MKTKLLCAILIILTGCSTCKRCYGQTVVDATDVAEFRRAIELAWNYTANRVAEETLKSLLAVEALPTGPEETITVSSAVYRRAMDPATTSSLYSRLLYLVGRVETAKKRSPTILKPADLLIYESVANAVGDATEKAEAKRAVDYLNRRSATAPDEKEIR